MKNKIYTYFFKEFSSLFLIILFALTAIVWTAQSVNYLDLVTEDGHAFSIYFAFSLLGVPKTITKLLPFTFLVATMLTILKFEKDNELIVMWTSGLNKMKIVNIIFMISIIITLCQLVTANSISPSALSSSRALLKNSNLHLFPSLVKEGKFNDTAERLTIFIEKKNEDGTIQNVFLRDDTKKTESSTIFAKNGYMKKVGSNNFLVLFDGVIQTEKTSGQISFINFEKTEFNLSNFKTKSVTYPKIQERTSLSFLKCLPFDSKICPYKKNDVISEVNRRIGMPLYIPIIALICCYLLSSRRENKRAGMFKYIYFFIAFMILIFAEISLRYSGKNIYITTSYYLVPVILFITNYFILYKIFKNENLKI